MKADNSAAHRVLVQETRKELGREPDLTLWLNSKGRWDAGEFKSTPGLGKGSSDIVGALTIKVTIIESDGLPPVYFDPIAIARFIALEAKTGTGRVSPEQKLFIELVRKRGGFAATFSSVEEARACIARARRGLCE